MTTSIGNSRFVLKRNDILKRYFGLLIPVILFMSLFSVIPQMVAQDLTATPWPTNGWQTSTPEEQGVDSEALTTLLESNTDAHTILAIRHGNVIVDASPYPFTSSQPHALFGVTQSFVSTLVGIAIDKGYIKSVNQSIWDFFPKEKTANMDTRKEAITIEDLLTQRSGLAVDDDLNIYKITDKAVSQVQYILDKPMQSEPGIAFGYFDANAHLASAIVQIATQMSSLAFAEQFLFAPLGITDATWIADPQGVNQGGSHLFMSPASMAKLGYLYLHNGEWDGQQVVSSDWVSHATSNMQPGILVWDGYGDFWYSGLIWRTQHRGYAALGYYMGQTIWVVPDLDLIVVTTNDSSFFSQSIVTSVVKASTSDKPLPANPVAAEALQARIDELALPQAAAAVSLPEIMKSASGKVYQLQTNDLGWTSIALEFGKADEALITIGLPDKELKLPVGLDRVYRVATDGFPAEPKWRPIANVPVMLKGGFLGKKLLLFMEDSMGMASWTLNVDFSKDSSKLWVSASQFLNEYPSTEALSHDLIGTSY